MEERRQYDLAVLIILVIFCWPAALIYYFTRPTIPVYPYPYGPPPQGQQPQAPQGQVTRICPQCGRVINNNDKYCPYCGKALQS